MPKTRLQTLAEENQSLLEKVKQLESQSLLEKVKQLQFQLAEMTQSRDYYRDSYNRLEERTWFATETMAGRDPWR